MVSARCHIGAVETNETAIGAAKWSLVCGLTHKQHALQLGFVEAAVCVGLDLRDSDRCMPSLCALV